MTSKRPARSTAFWFFATIAAYFAVQTGLRILYAPSIGLDEAEILITAQSAAWGHGSQPPLYNWLQIAFLEIAGPNKLALSALKNVLLAAIFAFTFLAGRVILEDDRKAAIAALALFTIPQIAWESQRALTHTVMVLVMAAATLLALVRLLRDGLWRDYLLLGVCLGLGAMSKYNYFIAAAGFVLAALCVRELRPRVVSWKMAASLGVALAIVLPHLLWVADNFERTLTRTGKFKASADSVFSLEPIGALLSAAFAYSALPLAVFGIAALASHYFRGKPDAPAVARTPLRRFALYIIPCGLLLILIGALAAGVTDMRERWMSPLLFVLPLALLILIEDRLTPRLGAALKGLSLALGMLAMAALAVHHLVPDLNKKPPEANYPFDTIAKQIRALGFERGTIIASSTLLGGSMKLQFPDSLVVEPQYGILSRHAPADTILAVWDRASAMPADIGELYTTLCSAPLPETGIASFTAPYEHGTALYKMYAALLGPCPQK